MNDLPRAFALAFSQLADPAILKVLAKVIAITLGLFAVLGFGLAQVSGVALEAWGADVETFGSLGTFAAIVFTFLAAWFLFRVVAVAVLQFFADDVVAAVEHRHYPDEAHEAVRLPFREDLSNSLRGIGRTLVLNGMALPIALLLLFTGIGPAIVFLLVNAVLLGRELTDMVRLRHPSIKTQQRLVSGPTRFVFGGAIAAMMLVPILNLLAPVIGAASATHLVHRSAARKSE